MNERCFGQVRFIPGENNGKYPFCHSVFVDGAGILIDPGSDRERLIRLQKESGVKAIWLTHWHEDHIMHLDLFDDVPFYISEQDAPMLSDIELFIDGYGLDKEDYRQERKEKYYLDMVKPFFPNLTLEDISLHQSGIRAKLKDYYDFVIERDLDYPNLINLIGIDSPGLTASLAISKYVKKLLEDII